MRVAAPLHDGGSRDALQIVADAIEPEHRARGDEPPHVLFLAVAELHHEPSAGRQGPHGRIEDATDVAQPVGSTEQRDVGLVVDRSEIVRT